jgi:hypothetical protein
VDLAGSEKWRASLGSGEQANELKVRAASVMLLCLCFCLLGHRPLFIFSIHVPHSTLHIQSSTFHLINNHRTNATQEMTTINASLHVLGNCVSALVEMARHQQFEREKERQQQNSSSLRSESPTLSSTGSTGVNSNKDKDKDKDRDKDKARHFHIPFRDSVLTRLLQDALRGSGR